MLCSFSQLKNVVVLPSVGTPQSSLYQLRGNSLSSQALALWRRVLAVGMLMGKFQFPNILSGYTNALSS